MHLHNPLHSPPKIALISLGCAKNLVDSEILLGSAASAGFEFTSSPQDADILVVNTCGFIDSAKEESIEAILEAHQERGMRKRTGQKLVVAGCLSQRFSTELARELRNEVDAFLGLDQVAQAGQIFLSLLSDHPNPTDDPLILVQRHSRFLPDWDTPRFRLTPPHYAYVKIAEGCNHPCSFCVIPQMRGRHRSRQIHSIVNEVRLLVQQGVKEINLISQDTTYYGIDLWPTKPQPSQPLDPSRGPTLIHLLDELAQIEGDFWIRILYTHPAHWSDALIASIAKNPKVVPYVDIPLQHSHPDILNSMQRQTSRQHIEELVAKLRANIPNLAIRTTFIVGFPGESDAHFHDLLDFIQTHRFERLGIFTYSQEEGSRAAKLPHQVPQSVKRQRFHIAMQTQKRIAQQLALKQVGKTIRILADSQYSARSQHDAPDIDTKVILKKPLQPGQFHNVKIISANSYDLVAIAESADIN
ncbi:MAG: 30S ribosomal protein S12 methylthiotransferase RimO [Chthoniobacterales bacterium]|nr:30S ribosomal protein S12 methylthiotransferase RimO [Chthoniobacterales bacterium]